MRVCIISFSQNLTHCQMVKLFIFYDNCIKESLVYGWEIHTYFCRPTLYTNYNNNNNSNNNIDNKMIMIIMEER